MSYEFDDLARDIHGRIDLETRERNDDYFRKRFDLEKKEQEDKHRLGENSLGVQVKYEALKENLDKEYAFKREIDQDRYQGYWDRLSAGTYTPATHDEKKEQKLDTAEKAMDALLDLYMTDIPEKHIQSLQKLYGKDILLDLAIRKKERIALVNEIKLKKEQDQKQQKENEKKPELDRFQRMRMLYDQKKDLTPGQDNSY